MATTLFCKTVLDVTVNCIESSQMGRKRNVMLAVTVIPFSTASMGWSGCSSTIAESPNPIGFAPFVGNNHVA